LVIRIEGKEKSTPYWVSKYARSYYSLNNNKKSITVPGIRLEKTALCLRYVVFESVYPDPKKNPREPVFIPFLREGECDEGTDESHDISLIPVWHGDKWHERLNVISLPYMPYYEKWSLDPDDPRGLTTESVAIPHLSPPNTSYNIENLHVSRSDKGVTVTIFNYNNDRDFCPSKLASMIYSCIVSERPTLDRPMTVVIPGDSLPVKYRMRLKADTSWKNGNSCEFAFDPTRLKLLKGNLPGYALKNNDGQLVVSILENENISDEKIIELVDDSDISMSSDMGLILFEKEKSVKFPFGYKIYDFQGNIIKSVSSDTGLIVRGKKLINTSSGKITAYLTTWGYKRYMEGKHLQWAVGLDSYEIK
jgi:hypothetical protein